MAVLLYPVVEACSMKSYAVRVHHLNSMYRV